MENVIITYFKQESEAYQALSDLKKNSTLTDDLTLSQVGLFKKSNDRINLEDGFDTGQSTPENTLEGGLVGTFLGVIGGPIGMLLGFGLGSAIGMAEDTEEAVEGLNLISTMTSRMEEGDVATVSVAQELSEKPYNNVVEKYDAVTERYRASEIQEEIEYARYVEKNLQKQAKKEMRQERSEKRKQKVEEYRSKFKEDFEELKKDFSSRN